MSANAKHRTHDENDNTPQPRYSTEARLAVVESRWQDVIPTLATKSDVALVKKDIEATEQRLNAKIEVMTSKIIFRISSIAVAAIAATGTIVALIQKLL